MKIGFQRYEGKRLKCYGNGKEARELDAMVEQISNKNTEDKITDILFKLGFTYSLKGTRFINDCILYSIVEDEDNVKKLYSEVAKKKCENI